MDTELNDVEGIEDLTVREVASVVRTMGGRLALELEEPLEDLTMDANHVRSLDALARKRPALVPQFDSEPLSTPPSTEYMSNQEKPAGRRTQ
jgi:hypothetical protein